MESIRPGFVLKTQNRQNPAIFSSVMLAISACAKSCWVKVPQIFSAVQHTDASELHMVYIYIHVTYLDLQRGAQLNPKGWRIDTLFWNHARHPYWRVAGIYDNIWVFPKIGVPQNGWFIMENPLFKWMIWGYHYFRKHPYRYMEPKWLYRPFCLEFGVSALGLGGSQTGSRDGEPLPWEIGVSWPGGTPFCHPNLGVARLLAIYSLLTMVFCVYIVYTSSWWFFSHPEKYESNLEKNIKNYTWNH